ncbi:MAG: FprA family A-type flavoprotein [Candidatus Saliniplasma sp.]
MAVKKIKEDIFEVGASHYDRELFDELIPLPDGTTYNAYLVKTGDETVLLDTVDPVKEERLMKNLESLGVDSIDYVISHHAEQDHSGSIPAILDKYPEAKVVTNEKCKGMLIDHLEISEDKFKEVEDEEELSIGEKTFKFMNMPWVHWPETMVTYLKGDNILFSCDFFGSHLAASNLFVDDKKKAYISAKRYYAEIMMPFRTSIKGHLKKLEDFDIDIIATSHGPIYDEPEFIMDAYKEWVSDTAKPEVVVPYVSMHGSTDKMVEHFVDHLTSKNFKVKPFNLTTTDIGELAMALVDASTVVIGTPTVLAGPHPKAVYAAYLANALRPKMKFASIIGSYGWGGRMPETIKDLLKSFNGEFIDPVIAKGHPTKKDLKSIEELADKIIKINEGSEEVKR